MTRTAPCRLFLAVVLIVSACGSDTDGTASSSSPDSADVGTVVTGSGGAEVRLPPEAAVGLDVSVEAVTSLDGLFPTGDPGAFVGGVSLEPHGTTFDAPVSITIPLTVRLDPGRNLRLYHWDGEGTAWEETQFFAVVADDGWSAVGEVTHFSYYVLQPSAVEFEQDGMFGTIEADVIELGRTGVGQADITRLVFDVASAHVHARFPLYSPVALDLPIVNGYNCYSPVGIFMLFDHGSGGVERPLTTTIGDIDNVEFRIDYVREVDVLVKHADSEFGIVGTMVANVYWRSQPPEFEVTASRSAMWGGESATITSQLTCGAEPMPDLEVDFTLVSDPSIASLSEELGFTDSQGRATSTVETTEEAGGLITVEVAHLWTDQPGARSAKLLEVVEIGVGGLTGIWEVSGRETWVGCLDPEDNGTYQGRGDVTFFQEGATFSGFGTFPRTSEVVVGTVQRTGPGAFVVNGSSNYVEDYGECDGDSCYEWFVSGTTTFEGIGSISTQTIQFEWSGADSSGDICTFTGSGTAERK